MGSGRQTSLRKVVRAIGGRIERLACVAMRLTGELDPTNGSDAARVVGCASAIALEAERHGVGEAASAAALCNRCAAESGASPEISTFRLTDVPSILEVAGQAALVVVRTDEIVGDVPEAGDLDQASSRWVAEVTINPGVVFLTGQICWTAFDALRCRIASAAPAVMRIPCHQMFKSASATCRDVAFAKLCRVPGADRRRLLQATSI